MRSSPFRTRPSYTAAATTTSATRGREQPASLARTYDRGLSKPSDISKGLPKNSHTRANTISSHLALPQIASATPSATLSKPATPKTHARSQSMSRTSFSHSGSSAPAKEIASSSTLAAKQPSPRTEISQHAAVPVIDRSRPPSARSVLSGSGSTPPSYPTSSKTEPRSATPRTDEPPPRNPGLNSSGVAAALSYSGTSPPSATRGQHTAFSSTLSSGDVDLEPRGRPSSVLGRASSGRSLSIAASPRIAARSSKAGRVGLVNHSNSCFMNSTLQCLGHTPGLCDWFLNNSLRVNKNSRTGGEFANAFQKVMHCMWKMEHSHFEPTELKTALRRHARRFTGDSQQDAQEFMRYLLDALHEDLNERPKVPYEELKDILNETVARKADRYWEHFCMRNESLISRLFCGQLKSTVQCLKCNNESTTFDPFMDLSLPIPKGKTRLTLQSCLELFTSEERLDGNDMVYCSHCKDHRPCTKKMSVFRLPNILVIHVKRFEFNSFLGTKLTDTVRYPVRNLDLAPFMDPNAPITGSQYSLYGVVHHFGSLRSGHYYAHCQDSATWMEFNDQNVRDLGSPEDDAKSAYILFYCRQGLQAIS